MKKITETARLYLREMTADDYDALYQVLRDSDIMQHYPYTFDEARVRGWISRNLERYKTDGFGLWAVCKKDTGEMIGDCGLTMQPILGSLLPEIGYHIRQDHQRQGYASEAAAAVRDWAFSHTDFDALYSYCKSTNIPSIRTAEAIGMRFFREYQEEGNEITHVSIMIRKEWQALKRSAIKLGWVNAQNFSLSSLDSFDRFQAVKCVFLLIDGKLVLREHPFTEDWSMERKREKAAEMLSGKYITCCAWDGERVVGGIMLLKQMNDRRMILDSFHVSREIRHCGVGRALFQAAAEEAKRQGADSLYISACSAEETIRFYLAMGCTPTMRPIPAYAEDEPYDIQMEYPLCKEE